MIKDPESIVFSPQRVSMLSLAQLDTRQRLAHEGVTTGISSLDKVLNPHRPGELRVILGYASNFKSGLMNFITRNAARQWAELEDNRVAITVTWEQSIEEQGIYDLAQIAKLDAKTLMRGELESTDWSALRTAGAKRGALPWWLFGHSTESHERRPRLSMTDVAGALEYLVDVQKVDVGLICLDYIQRIRREGDASIREQFIEIVDRCKDMALAFHVPVMAGCQAGRSVKTQRKWYLPQLDDGQETSNLEQSADSVISLWMPKQDYPQGHRIEYGAQSFEVTPNLLILGVMKQKFGSAPHIMPMHVEPGINQVYAMETRQL